MGQDVFHAQAKRRQRAFRGPGGPFRGSSVVFEQQRFPKPLPDIAGRPFPDGGFPAATQVDIGKVALRDCRSGFLDGQAFHPAALQGPAARTERAGQAGWGAGRALQGAEVHHPLIEISGTVRRQQRLGEGAELLRGRCRPYRRIDAEMAAQHAVDVAVHDRCSQSEGDGADGGTVMASEVGLRAALSQYTGDFSAVQNAVKSTNEEIEQKKASADVKTITQDSPISKALATILDYAARSKASDIHIEPLEDSLIIRCRVDGVLRKVMELPKTIEPALVSRIKILSNLKIDEHRIPQDGQFTVAVAGKEVDLRISISPVVWGEQVVIRILDKSGTALDIETMGMAGHALKMVERGISRPNGMILTSGPTGSGKSTTLYALIRKIFDEKINIVTLEDPVEYKMDGINQIQVNVDAGLTFATGLRSILRQDPDAVMVS